MPYGTNAIDIATKLPFADRHGSMASRMTSSQTYAAVLGEVDRMVRPELSLEADATPDECETVETAIDFMVYGLQLGLDYFAEFGPMAGLDNVPVRELFQVDPPPSSPPIKENTSANPDH